MIIKTKMTEYPCFRAERHKENIHLFDEKGNCFTELVNPYIVSVEGGDIVDVELPEPTAEERLAALEAAMLEMIGVNIND